MKREIKASKGSAYFAASNSRGGFCSYYEGCFRLRVDQMYCIKGGPGTGKSTLMRRMAACAQRLGWRVEYYYCSSDASSLDAVLLFGKDRSVGFIDATAPHVFESSLPGVREHIVDLGRFWNTTSLSLRGEDIKEYNRVKSEGYRSAYRMLCGAGEVSDAIGETVSRCVNGQRLHKLVGSMFRGAKTAAGTGERRVRLSDSVGMRGRVRLDTYLRECERLCLIEDYYDSAYLLTSRLAQLAADEGQGVDISYHPVLPDRIDALLFRESKTAFVVCESGEIGELTEQFSPCRIIRMKRLMLPQPLREVRKELRRQYRLREALLDEAGVCLERVAQAHFALENIYGEAMDFGAEEAYARQLCLALFGENE